MILLRFTYIDSKPLCRHTAKSRNSNFLNDRLTFPLPTEDHRSLATLVYISHRSDLSHPAFGSDMPWQYLNFKNLATNMQCISGDLNILLRPDFYLCGRKQLQTRQCRPVDDNIIVL